MVSKLFNKFKSYIYSASALAINKNRYPIYRYGNRNIFWLIIEFLNLIKWISIGILRYSQFNFALNGIDKKTFIYACVFNSFSIKELIFFSKLNINKWYELKDLVPSNMIKPINKKKD